VERLAPLTVETYCQEIKFYLPWLRETAGMGPETADLETLHKYLEMRAGEKTASRTRAKGSSALRSFHRFLADMGYREDNPAASLESPKLGERLPDVQSREAVDYMLSLIDTDTVQGIRDRALFELIYSSGLRVSEAVALNLEDLNFDEGIAIVRGKGSKERLVIFGREAENALRRYLADARPTLTNARTAANSDNARALFLNRTGGRLSRKGIWKNYAAYTAAAGMSSHIHSLRHSFATEMLAGGADLRSLQELMGHASLATTQIYTHVDTAQLRARHDRYLPRLADYTEAAGQ
jgi:integrase/recombinase XerD